MLRARYTEEVEQLRAKLGLHVEWVAALRLALNRESAEVGDDEQDVTGCPA
jgi:hypothetical protein